VDDEPVTDSELDELERLAEGASPPPWHAFVGPGIGGEDFISLGADDSAQPDMYVQHDGRPAPAADLKFIAACRNYLPRLIAEVRRGRGIKG
jgi:hypothetical protein